MKRLLILLVLMLPGSALAFNAVTVYGTTEENKPVRLQYVTDVQVERFRLAGVANFDDQRYQIKPRVTVDLVSVEGVTLQLAYQREWFVNNLPRKHIDLDMARYGAGIRHTTGPVTHELNLYTTRVEDFLTVRFAPKWAVNNQFWTDFETKDWWNQLSLSYRLTPSVSLVAQHAAQANRQDILRGGISWKF